MTLYFCKTDYKFKPPVIAFSYMWHESATFFQMNKKNNPKTARFINFIGYIHGQKGDLIFHHGQTEAM